MTTLIFLYTSVTVRLPILSFVSSHPEKCTPEALIRIDDWKRVTVVSVNLSVRFLIKKCFSWRLKVSLSVSPSVCRRNYLPVISLHTNGKHQVNLTHISYPKTTREQTNIWRRHGQQSLLHVVKKVKKIKKNESESLLQRRDLKEKNNVMTTNNTRMRWGFKQRSRCIDSPCETVHWVIVRTSRTSARENLVFNRFSYYTPMLILSVNRPTYLRSITAI